MWRSWFFPRPKFAMLVLPSAGIFPYRNSIVFASCSQSFARYAQTFRFLLEKQAVVFLSVIFTSFKCPRQESNLHFSLRRAVSYPLNDKGVDLKFQNSGDDGDKRFLNLFFFKILQKIPPYLLRVGVA